MENTSALLTLLWTMVCTALVFFMQAGFCCLEAGTVRSKNSINVALKNVTDFLIAALLYFAVGYSLMFGAESLQGLVGRPNPMLIGMPETEAFAFLFQLVFCGTAATIVSGAVAERLRFLPYALISIFLALLIYPVFGHWVWHPDGWLARLGYHDFAGSSVVHMVGGIVALAGVQVVGARADRFDDEGRPREMSASNIPLVAVGVIILFFGWIGFNGGSAAFSEGTGVIVLNTVLAGVFAGLVCLLVGWATQGIAGVGFTLNGVLAGLVGITAGADVVSPQAAVLIGLLCGGVYFLADKLLLRLRLDDAVGAVAVHAAAGAAGVLLVALFAGEEAMAAMGHVADAAGRMRFLGIQAVGVVSCFTWCYLVGLFAWKVIGRVTPLRVSGGEEKVGLNYSEHGVRSPAEDMVLYIRHSRKEGKGELPLDIEHNEYGRVAAEVRRWNLSMEEVLNKLREQQSFLESDSKKMGEMVERCYRESLIQQQALEVVGRKVTQVERTLRAHAQSTGDVADLAFEVMESTREKISEVESVSSSLAHYWEQIRALSNSLSQRAHEWKKGVAF